MTAITLIDKETAIKKKLIKAASKGKKVFYSDLIEDMMLL